jgi:SAM-dependent methyltransferase
MKQLPVFMAPYFKRPRGILGIYVSHYMQTKHEYVYSGIEQYSEIKNGDLIFEIGYGPGKGIRYFLEKYNVRIDGVDFSNAMYRKALQKNKYFVAQKRMNLFYLDFKDMKIQNEKYDVILFANVLYFWKDLKSIFSKIRSMLRDKGRLVFYMSSPERLRRNRMTNSAVFKKYAVSEVEACLNECGYTGIGLYNIVDESGDYKIIRAYK